MDFSMVVAIILCVASSPGHFRVFNITYRKEGGHGI